ncbi:hypothetical protein NDN08_004369 [Rhodosorus marinus]|uniref:Uncharacterized protein n=1 Tax=Rhodosorus marinus TaxID=101924 RepID=A0AAV8UL26_9RHOD|nr:hypothetical protein NDN08_004369 [Rhodosorus marinus]
MDFSKSSVAEIQNQVSALTGQLSELEQLSESDPENAEHKALVAEVREFISSLKDLISEKKKAEAEKEKEAAVASAAPASGRLEEGKSLGAESNASNPVPVAQTVKKKKKKKAKKEDDLAKRAQSWQKFSSKSSKKKSIFASPEEGSSGRVGFHSSSNTMTEFADRKRHDFTEE